LQVSLSTENVRSEEDETSRYETLYQIPKYKDRIVISTQSQIRPEINFWLWEQDQLPDLWESMLNQIELSQSKIHADVYEAILSRAGEQDLEQAKLLAEDMRDRVSTLQELSPALYEFYIYYYLHRQQPERSAVWNGLYANYVKHNPGVNQKFYELHTKLNKSKLQQVEERVETIIRKTDWGLLKIKDLPDDIKS
jgi:uncharacterized protein YoxC